MAVAGFIVPASERNGFNIETDAFYTRGGIYLSKPITINEPNLEKIIDPTSEENKYGKAVSVGDEVQLNIVIPDLGVDLQSVQLEVQYDSTVFKCTQWYQDGDESGLTEEEKVMVRSWPSISSFGSDMTEGWKSTFKKDGDTDGTKRLVVTAGLGASGGEKVKIKAFSGINDKNYNPAGGTPDPTVPAGDYIIFVARFTVLNSSTDYKKVQFDIKEHLFYSYDDDGGSGTDQWDPIHNPTSCFITGKVNGQLNLCESAYEKEDLYIHVGFDAAVLSWYQNEGIPVPEDDIKVDKDGKFSIRGLIPGRDCTLTVHTWCINDTKTISVSNMQQDLSWDLWLYGDVDHNGRIEATDVTQILRYIVGKNSEFKKSTDAGYDEETEANRLKVANVTYETDIGLDDGDNAVNVLDATQILRYVCNWIGDKSVFWIHSNKYLYEAFPEHHDAGDTFPGKTYIP